MQPSSKLLALTECYLKFVLSQYERLTFSGISRGSKALSLPLSDVYVELKAVADVPDAADPYNAEERRLLGEAEVRGRREDPELRMQLDALRVERWRKEGQAKHARFQRRSIEESVADPGQASLVILGDPGSGKSSGDRRPAKEEATCRARFEAVAAW